MGSGDFISARFDFLLECHAGFPAGGDDEDGVVSRNGAGDFRKFGCVHGGGKRLSAAGRRFENEKIFRRANVEKKFAKGAGERRKGRGFFRDRGGLFYSLRAFLTSFSSWRSRERVAWVTRRRCDARRRRKSSWLAMRSPETRRRIWP